MRASFALLFTALVATSALAATPADAFEALNAAVPGGLTRRQVPTIPGGEQCPVCQDAANASSKCSSASDPMSCICSQSTVDGIVDCVNCAVSKGADKQSLYSSAQQGLDTIGETCASAGHKVNIPNLSSNSGGSNPPSPSNSGSNPAPSSGSGSGSGNGNGSGSGNTNDPFEKGNGASAVRITGAFGVAAAALAFFA